MSLSQSNIVFQKKIYNEHKLEFQNFDKLVKIKENPETSTILEDYGTEMKSFGVIGWDLSRYFSFIYF